MQFRQQPEGTKAQMSGCSCGSDVKFEGLSAAYKRALWVVIAINGAMFVVEMLAGTIAGSQALKADALDFLGDTATYAVSMFVIGMPLVWRARAALFKGLSLGAMGLWVLGSTAYHVLLLGLPRAEVMGLIGLLALLANLASVLILLKYRNGDANVRSVWLCSRNDALGNLAVVFAAGGVWTTETAWPDLIVAGVMASLFLWSSVQIVHQASQEMTIDDRLPTHALRKEIS
jgi:Co/Zn/Cd efflux system component